MASTEVSRIEWLQLWHKTSINGNYLWWNILTDMTMVKISDCFHYIIIIFVMLCNEVGRHDLQIRQISGKFADRAVQLADWQIGRSIYK